MIALRSAGTPEVVITGISRSGTSYLCNLLHRFENCVAINEPNKVRFLLQREKAPWSLPLFYRDRRRDVLSGTPIKNKLLGGEVVEDTAVYEEHHRYQPEVAVDDFVLAVKNTREFLLRLEAVRRVLPRARVVACVRNPLDTIASWKRSFAHLRDADVTPFTGHPHQMWLSGADREALARIDATADSAERRARFWRLLADRVLANRDGVLLVDYDDLVSEPLPVLGRILDGYHSGGLRRPIAPSSASDHRHLLDDDDRRAIQTICTPLATELGLATE